MNEWGVFERTKTERWLHFGLFERDNCVEKIFELKYFSPITCGGLLPRGTSWRHLHAEAVGRW
jgi:hypothetical protein